MLKNLSEFTELVKKHAKENTISLHKEGSIGVIQAMARLIPVDTGRATANTLAGVNTEPAPRPDLFDKSKSARPTADRARKDLSGLKFGDDIIVRNAVSEDLSADGYIIKLEMGASPQNRGGFFIKTVKRSRAIFKNKKRKLGI